MHVSPHVQQEDGTNGTDTGIMQRLLSFEVLLAFCSLLVGGECIALDNYKWNYSMC